VYTKEEDLAVVDNNSIDLEFLERATEIAQWSVTRYGYFVNSHTDKTKLVSGFAEELQRLPVNCLSFITKAQNKWIDEGHKRPPQIADFISILREFNNAQINEKDVPQLEGRRMDYAGMWDCCKTVEERADYMKRIFDRTKVPPGTKYHVAKYWRSIGWPETKIQGAIYGRN